MLIHSSTAKFLACIPTVVSPSLKIFNTALSKNEKQKAGPEGILQDGSNLSRFSWSYVWNLKFKFQAQDSFFEYLFFWRFGDLEI